MDDNTQAVINEWQELVKTGKEKLVQANKIIEQGQRANDEAGQLFKVGDAYYKRAERNWQLSILALLFSIILLTSSVIAVWLYLGQVDG